MNVRRIDMSRWVSGVLFLALFASTLYAPTAFGQTPPQVSISAPACTDEPQVDISGSVSADAPVQLVVSTVNGGPEQPFCLGCGVDPVLDILSALSTCDNLIEVTAEDTGGQVGSATTVVRFDDEPPVLTCPDDIFVNAVTSSGADVFFTPPSAVDACDGSLPLRCFREDQDFVRPGDEARYRHGTTNTFCPLRDTCNNFATCGFNVTVMPFGAALPAAGCEFRDFRDNLLLDFEITGVIKDTIGDTDRIVDISYPQGGEVEVETGPIGLTEDNAYFLYRPVVGDFRVETPVPDSNSPGLGGVMVRWGLDTRAARALVALNPQASGGATIDFRVRTFDTQNDQTLATSISATGVTDLAIEVEGNRLTAQYSTDGGHSWITPAGAAATVTTVGDPLAGVFVSSGDLSNRSVYTFPYLELCPILGVDPGTTDPPLPTGGACRTDDFEDGSVSPEWTLAGVGNANQQSVNESSGVLELTADGATAFAGDDNAGFLYQEISGDFRVEVTVDGTTMITGGPFRKAGLMVRESLDDGAPRLLAQLAPFWNNADETHLQWVVRETQDGPGNTAIATDVVGVPRIVRLAIERYGDDFTVEYSTDGGATWITPTGGLGGSVTVPMAETLLVGLDMVSNNISVTSTALFDDFSLCPPCLVSDDHDDGVVDPGWTLVGVGNANQESALETGGVLELTADGATAFYGADNAGFLYREVSGDFRIETTIDGSSMTTGGLYRKAGIMVRQSLDKWDVRLIAQLAPFWENQDETHLQFVARDAFGAPGRLPVARDVIGVPRIVRLAVERQGDVMSVEYSLDEGATWIQPTTGLGGSITIPGLAETLLVGLDMVSNNISVTSTAKFDDTLICPLR